MESSGNLDKEALQELRAAHDRIAEVWPAGTHDVLTQRNPDLLTELDRAESVLDSLLVIPNWPPALRKQWCAALAEYEKTAMLCVTYAKRHLVLTQGK